MEFRRTETADLDFLHYLSTEADYSEFFRRIPYNLTLDQFRNFENLTSSQAYTFFNEKGIAGYGLVSDIDPYGMSAQVGLILDKKYWDVKSGLNKVSFNCLTQLCHYLFQKSPLYKVQFCCLSSRLDLIKSLEKGGCTKDGNFKESVWYEGRYQDETYLGITREKFYKTFPELN